MQTEFDRNAVVTIQGGGVYGLSLLGQLQAVLDAHIQPVALAGTSDGAIAATLYWAGLDPETIRDHFIDLSRSENGLINLVGPFDSAALGPTYSEFRGLSQRIAGYASWLRRQFRSGLQRNDSRWLQWLRHLYMLPTYVYALPLDLAGGFRVAQDVREVSNIVAQRGVFTGRNFELEIDRLLRQGIKRLELPVPVPPPGKDNGRLLTFGDFRRLGAAHDWPFPPLFLAATNLRSRQMDLFDSTNPAYDFLEVARAVRASAGFPLFFRPVDIHFPNQDASYIDGGVICNFPAFVFEDAFRQRLLQLKEYNAVAMRPWIHIGLRLTDGERPHVARELHDSTSFLKAIVALATGAARTDLEGRLANMISRSLSIAQPFADTNGPLGVLAIEQLDRRVIETMFQRGRDFAAKVLVGRSFRLPDPQAVDALLESLLRQACAVFNDPANTRCKFRTNVFIPELDELVLRYRVNMDTPEDTDRDSRFPFDCGLAGFGFTRRRPTLCNLKQFATLFAPGAPIDPKIKFGFTREMQDQMRKDRSWLLAMPIMDPFGSYPREIAPNPIVGVSGLHYIELDSFLDGAVFGILNLDAGFDYGTENLPDDPETMVLEPRIQAITALYRRSLFAWVR